MRRICATLAAVLACGGAASAGGPPPVLAVQYGSQGQGSLAWVDALSLQAIPGGELVNGDALWPLARSPGGRYLLTVSARTDEIRLRVVDLSSKRASPIFRLDGANGAHAVWTGPARVVLVPFLNGQAVGRLVLATNPLRIERRSSLSGQILAARPVGRQLVVLLGSGRIGPLRLALVGKDGVRTVAVEGIRGGTEHEQDEQGYHVRQAIPGLAVDPSGRRAVVVARGAVAEVDLSRMEAQTRALAGRRLQKVADGWWRQAVWVSERRIAVAGHDYEEGRGKPSGLQLIDVRDGTVRMLDEKAADFAVWRGRLLAWGGGLSSYTSDGTMRYRVADASIGDVMVGATFLYVNESRDRSRFRVVDPADGRTIGRAQTERPTYVVRF